MRLGYTIAAALVLAASPATAQMTGMDHSAHGADASGAMAGYMAAMDTMMADMEGMESTGDADADYLLMMIPHHQSAVDMSRTLLEEGQDPEVKALAETIIASQEAEIAEMNAMLERLGHAAE